MAADRFKIIDGPSKWDLMLALFERKPVTFKIGYGAEIDVQVEALFNEYEWATVTLEEFSDDSQGNWLIEGTFYDFEKQVPKFMKKTSIVREDYVVCAAYSSVKREGVLRCVESEFGYGDMTRFHLGDRIWGDQTWREKEL